MSSALTLVEWGTVPAVAVCAAAWLQQRSLRHPSPRQAAALEKWSQMPVLAQFGVRVGADRYIYRAGRILGPLDGAKAELAPHIPVAKVKPSTGWAVITFADGTVHRNPYRLTAQPQAQAELARFQALASATPAGQFQRNRPASMAP